MDTVRLNPRLKVVRLSPDTYSVEIRTLTNGEWHYAATLLERSDLERLTAFLATA